MNYKSWGIWLFTSMLFASIVTHTSKVWAQEIEPYIGELEQVTNVNQLKDVAPTDWAYEALRSLVDRYGCIAGFPNQTYRGSQALTRYEFAAGLNSCLNQIERLITSSETVSQEDLDKINRLTQEFEAELATIGGRVDNLESRTAFLEDHQFSTTTKLAGEVSFALSSVFGDERADGSGEIDNVPVFDYRALLNFNTSFTGSDLLQVSLSALNTTPFGSGEEEDDPNVTGTNMTRLAFDEGTDGSVEIDKAYYTFALGAQGGSEDEAEEFEGLDGEEELEEEEEEFEGAAEGKLSFVIDAVGGEFSENFTNYNEYFSEEISGAVSFFGRFNPIYYQGSEGTGATVNYDLNDAIALSVGYLAPRGNEPFEGAGLFNGTYSAIAQIGIEPTENLGLGLTYSRAYYAPDEQAVSGEAGSENANAPFGEEIPTSADHFGLQGSYQLSDRINISAWGGFSLAYAETDGENEEIEVNSGDNANIFNWAVTLAFPDLLAEGNLGGIIFGQPPKVTSNDGGEEDEDSAWHIEALYRYQVNDNISVDPGFFVVLNPENDSDNDTIWVASVRTVFEF